MSIVVPFPGPSRAELLMQEEEDQVQAIRAMLRYLHRESKESGLPGTTDMIAAALQALERDVAYGVR